MLVTDVTTRLAARRPGPWDEVQAAYRTELDRLHEGLRASVEGTPLCPVAMQLIAAGGKRVRPLLGWISCAAVGGDTERVAGVALASELSHAATLLHDDVLDDSAERRGVPAARILYGNQLSVLAGDFLLSRALEVVARTHSQPLLLAYCHCLEELICGEVMQHENCFRADVTEAVYRRIIELKTASLFAWTAQGAARLAGADEELSAAFERFGRGLGLAF
ncbi:MAG: octaprenyl-diphosphate synthase, partial [Acidobacteria bacterium]